MFPRVDIGTKQQNPMQLYQHQKNFLTQNPDKSTLVWSCGTGKTRTAIEWAKLNDHPDCWNTLIICPKALKQNWKRECIKNGFDAHIYSKEEFRKSINTKGFLSEWCLVRNVIVDEVHNGFLTPQFKSKMSKALRNYIKEHNIPRVLLLSATVYTSSPWNIYSLAYFTGHVWDYLKFRHTFFYDVQMGMRTISVPKKGIEGKLAELTKKIASVVDIHDCLDVPEQLHCEPEYFALTKEQIKGIKTNYDPVPIVRYTAQHEIEQGILLGNEFRESQTFECDKYERILELVKETKKVAIVCRYNIQINLLMELLEEYKPLVIRGDVKDRDAVTLQAEESDNCVVLIQADCAEGYQLPSFELCIFASQSYSYTKWEQICGRFLRMDKPSRTTFVYLLTEGESIDQAVYDSVKRKEDFKIQLYEKRS